MLTAGALALAFLPRQGDGPTFATEAFWTVALAAATGLALAGVSRLVAADIPRRTIIGTLLTLWAGLFGTIRLVIGPLLGLSPAVLLVAWSVLITALLLLVRGARAPGPGLIRGLSAALIALFAMNAVPVAQRARRAPETRAQGGDWVDARSEGRPDVYLIVLDKYSRPDHLARSYGLDVTPFADSLRALGFVIPERARTNYAHTQLVLAALLNGRLVHNEVRDAGDDPWHVTNALIEEAALWRQFTAQGYRTAFFPTGFPATHRQTGADMVLSPPEPAAARRGETWILNTPIDLLLPLRCRAATCETRGGFPYPIESAEALRWKFEQLTILPDSAGPLAVFMHFLGTHEPYVFEADCTTRDPWWPASDHGADSAAVRRAYAAQLACVNRLLLSTIRTIIARSAVPPVILVQSDHGHGRIARDPVRGITLTLGEATEAQIAERMDVFAAYLFPGADRMVHDSITPANLLPAVFDALFGTQLPRSPDLSFWSSYQRPLDLTAIPAPPR